MFSVILDFNTNSKSQVSNIHLSFGELGVTYHDTVDFNQTIFLPHHNLLHFFNKIKKLSIFPFTIIICSSDK